jgi:hypothetical protein
MKGISFLSQRVSSAQGMVRASPGPGLGASRRREYRDEVSTEPLHSPTLEIRRLADSRGMRPK